MHTLTFCFAISLSILNFTCEEPVTTNQDFTMSSREATPPLPILDILDSLKIDKDLLWIDIDKTEFILQLKYDTLIVKTYPVVLGGNPVDDKKMQGDRCTPEGEFQLRATYPHKFWSKFMWIDYPTAESWQKFNANKESGVIASTASIGGEIGIHGVPEGYDHMIDEMEHWTAGCISLKNKDVNEIYTVVQVGTKVVIHK